MPPQIPRDGSRSGSEDDESRPEPNPPQSSASARIKTGVAMQMAVDSDSEEAKDLEDENESDRDDEDEDTDTYQVEYIKKHKWEGKRLLYHIKWLGYKDKDSTWEPEGNLLPDAADILAKYHKKIGGAPQPLSSKKSKPIQPPRQPHPQSSDEEPPAPKKRKHAHLVENSSSDIGTWLPRKEDWESEIALVDTVQKDSNDNLFAFLHFKNGKKAKVSMDQVYKHCPLSMLKFYETHLKFS